MAPDSDERRKKLELPISSMDLSVRAQNCLESQEIKTVGDLVRYTEAELLKVRNFGKTTLLEIKTKLRELGLALGMTPAGAAAAQ